jgi:hypothetical protein
MSISAISSALLRVRSPFSPPIFNRISITASTETGVTPARAAQRARAPRSSAKASRRHQARVIGQMRNETSFITSTNTPPRPVMIIGPNSGSTTPPIDHFKSGRQPSPRSTSCARRSPWHSSAASISISALLDGREVLSNLPLRHQSRFCGSLSAEIRPSEHKAAAALQWLQGDRQRPARRGMQEHEYRTTQVVLCPQVRRANLRLARAQP